MRSIQNIFSDILLDIILQMDHLKKGYKESFLRSELISKIKNFDSSERLWENIYVDEEYPVLPHGKHKYCDIYFEEFLTEIKKDNFIRTFQQRKKSIWIELKFLTPEKNQSSPNNINNMMIDFLRLLFCTPLKGDYGVERYFIVLMQCGDDVNYGFYDPPKYFGIKRNPKSKRKISKLIYPKGTEAVNLSVKACLSHLSKKTLKEAQLITSLRTLSHFIITRRFIGPVIFDSKSPLKKDQIFGYVFKLCF